MSVQSLEDVNTSVKILMEASIACVLLGTLLMMTKHTC
ncbi:hypothetical protein Avbf_11979 [Armadillidium vulgare]|nr:hypothetical protein Avbf_11979 [Armadillidium vulgare]